MNKRLLGIFIGVGIAVVVIVVCCVMFLIGSIEVRTADNLVLEDSTVEAIVSQSGIAKGDSVFAINEAQAIAAIEKANPELKAVDIERKFPNKVVIYIAERTPIMSVALVEQESGEKLYAKVDNELKIVGITGADGVEGLTRVENFTVNGGEEALGSFLSGDECAWLKGIVDGAYKVTNVDGRFSALIENIEYSDQNVTVRTTRGVSFVLKKVSDIEEMFVGAYKYFVASPESEQTKGYVYLTDIGWKWSETAIN